MNKKYLVLGKNGQVGSALCHLLGDNALALDAGDVDFLAADVGAQLDRLTTNMNFSAVINAAAYTQVDAAEGAGREAAFRINGEAVGELAQWCAAKSLPLVHYSTDYVFDGSGNTPRNENATAAPLNVYGESKLLGEQLIAQSGAQYFVLRTSWVYDAFSKNFFNTMRRLFLEKESLNIVADQIGAPTYAPHLAAATLQLLARGNSPFGIYHVCGGGQTSWHGFANAIFALASAHESGIKCASIHPISSADYKTAAKRPLNSRLDTGKLAALGISLPHWEEGLHVAINEAYGNTHHTT